MSNKNKLYRSGCTPRVIFYSQTSKGHEYNYGNPLVTISGRNSRHIIQNSSKERKLLDYIKPHPQPNTNRTIIPNSENLDVKALNKNSKINYGTMDNNFCEIKNNKQKSSIKISKNKNKTSSDLLSNFREEKKEIDNNKTKNNFSSYIKNKYDYSSEIMNLPGGKKRQLNDINDDFIINPSLKKRNMHSTANCFRQRNINPSKNDYIVCDTKQKIDRPFSMSKLKTNYENCRNNNKYNKFTNLLNSSNIVFYNNNCDSRQYTLNNNSNNIATNYNNEKYCVNNKENYLNNNSNNNTIFSNYKTNEEKYFLKSKERINQKYKNEMNNNNNFHFYQPINNNTLFPNYYEKVYKEKNNSLVTPYNKRKNANSHNQLFNEVHQQDKNYSLLNYYGKNYSKKNYSQIEFH
jgi:hypothetical protein